MKKIFGAKNIEGFSLASVLVAAGLVGVVSLAVMQLNKMTQKSMTTYSTGSEIISILAEMRLILSDPDNCNRTFGGQDATDGTANNNSTGVAPSLHQKKSSNSASFMDKYLADDKTRYGQGAIKIKNYQLDSDKLKLTDEESTTLWISFYRGKASMKEVVKKKIELTVQVSNLAIDDFTITSCISKSAGASNVWLRNNSDPAQIYYNGGNVGVGTTDAIQPLHVQAPAGMPVNAPGVIIQNGIFRIDNMDNNIALDFGISDTATNPSSWIQSVNQDDLSDSKPLHINPNGGDVFVGLNSGTSLLSVDGEVKISALDNTKKTCLPTQEGQIRYNKTPGVKSLEFCNGTDWKRAAGGTNYDTGWIASTVVNWKPSGIRQYIKLNLTSYGFPAVYTPGCMPKIEMRLKSITDIPPGASCGSTSGYVYKIGDIIDITTAVSHADSFNHGCRIVWINSLNTYILECVTRFGIYLLTIDNPDCGVYGMGDFRVFYNCPN